MLLHQPTLTERLDAYEDALESEVGDTMLVRARNLERETGLSQIYLKFEGDNPTGTHKDRIAWAQCMDALRRGFEGICLASCGNYGAAAAYAAAQAELGCVVVIPEEYRSKRVDTIERSGAEVLRVPGDYEAAVEWSRQYAAERGLYDANPGGDNEIVQLRAYAEIAAEIYDVLRDAPAAIAAPVSNGTTAAGLHRGFVSLHRRGRTSRLPKLVVGSAHRQNPIVHAWKHNLATCEDLPPGAIRETAVNEPLVNWHAIDGDAALSAVRSTDGWAGDASDKAMQRAARVLRENLGLTVQPASTAGLVALLDRHRTHPLPKDRYVVLLTGRSA